MDDDLLIEAELQRNFNQSINQFIDERIKTTTDIVIKINAN